MEDIIRQYWTEEAIRPLDTSVLERSIREFRRALAFIDGTRSSPAQQECARAFRYGIAVMERELTRRSATAVPPLELSAFRI